jgi:hypothetical protein
MSLRTLRPTPGRVATASLPLLLAACVAATATACAAGGRRAPSVATGVRLPSAFSESYVFLRAHIGGQPMLLLFDSGAGATVLLPEVVSRLGLAERGRRLTFGLGGTAPQARTYEGVTIRIGRDSIAVPAVMSWPDAELPSLGIERAVGVIGADLLLARVLEIDWIGSTVTAWDTSTVLRTGSADDVVPLTVSQSLPVLAVHTHTGVRVDTVPVVVDYGSSAALILDGSAEAGRRIAPAMRDVRTRRVIGVGGAVDGPEGRVDSIGLGRQRIRAPLTFIDTAGVRSVSLAGAQGMLGTELLRRFSVVLDYTRGRAIFRPTRRLTAPFCRNASGVCFDRTSTSLPRVAFVDQGSPAGRAGLLTGDILVTLDGAAASELADRDIDARLDQSGVSHVVEVRRGASASGMTGVTVSPQAARQRAPRPPATVLIRWRL